MIERDPPPGRELEAPWREDIRTALRGLSNEIYGQLWERPDMNAKELSEAIDDFVNKSLDRLWEPESKPDD